MAVSTAASSKLLEGRQRLYSMWSTRHDRYGEHKESSTTVRMDRGVHQPGETQLDTVYHSHGIDCGNGGDETDMKPRALLTVGALGAIAMMGLYVGNELITGAAVGALASYLGRMNGRSERESGTT